LEENPGEKINVKNTNAMTGSEIRNIFLNIMAPKIFFETNHLVGFTRHSIIK
jgi:hypothetical protein